MTEHPNDAYGLLGDPLSTGGSPAAVTARMRSADSLRAELAGVVAERDALREELDTAAWERDTAQNEAAFLRDEVLSPVDYRRALFDEKVPRTVGLLLTMGDEPPPPPEDEHAEDIALVSLSTADIYVRNRRAPDQWMRYGQTSSVSDFTTMAEHAPWITVRGWRLRDHAERAQAERDLYSALHDAHLGQARWPESAQHAMDRITALRGDGFMRRSRNVAAWISAWQSLAGACRSAWHDADAQLAKHLAECEALSDEKLSTAPNGDLIEPGGDR
jgi:hypothetical protein